MRTREQIEKDARDGRNAFGLMIEVMLDVRQFFMDETARREEVEQRGYPTITSSARQGQ